MLVFSLTGDHRGESALALVPPSSERDELLIAAEELTACDTYSAVALRAAAEFYARYRQQPVTFCPPADSGVWDLLANLMGRDLPAHFTLSGDASPPAPSARCAVLPCQRITSIADVHAIAEHMPEIVGENYGMRPAIFLATAFSVFAENALQHASTSPIGAVAGVGYEREAEALQLVVTDLGPGLTADRDPYEAIIQMVERSQGNPRGQGVLGGLAGLVADAQRKGIDLELRIASGAGRLSWRAGAPNVSEAQAVPGFTAAAILNLDE
jgi:anti-sigma regulatory factor (Ser/Thr protein kinase)